MSEENSSVIIITRGEKAEFDIFLEKESFPRCVDLSGYDKFTVCFPSETGDPLIVTEGAGVALIAGGVYGQLKVTLTPAQTALLEVSFGQDLDIEWDVTATPAPKRKRLHKALNVEDSICL